MEITRVVDVGNFKIIVRGNIPDQLFLPRQESESFVIFYNAIEQIDIILCQLSGYQFAFVPDWKYPIYLIRFEAIFSLENIENVSFINNELRLDYKIPFALSVVATKSADKKMIDCWVDSVKKSHPQITQIQVERQLL